MEKIYEFIKKKALGIILVFVIAVVSRLIYQNLQTDFGKKIISEVIIAISLGFIIKNLFTMPEIFSEGIKFSLSKILRLGIILMGLRLSFQDIISTGMDSILLIMACIFLVTIITVLIIKMKIIPNKLAILIGIGTTICGNSAIIATSPVIKANEEDTSFAIATITLFGLIAVIVYPLIGSLLGLSNSEFGLWAGTAVNDTSQVIAAASSFSQEALNVATVVKLIRNSLMVPIIFFTGIVFNVFEQKMSNTEKTEISIKSAIPWFVIGFLLMATFRTLGNSMGIFPKEVNYQNNLEVGSSLLMISDQVCKFFILMALSAIGLNTKLSDIIKIGLKPLIFGLTLSIALASFSLLSIYLFII